MRWSMAARNAASVFPEPVGARTSTLSPFAIAGQASSCARVGAWNVASNQARVAGLKVASGSLPTNTEVTVPRMEIGLGIDSRFALSDGDQRTIAREAAGLGYTSLWTPIGNTREPFDICVAWHDASGLPTGIAVAPVSAWPIEKVASVAKETRADPRKVHAWHWRRTNGGRADQSHARRDRGPPHTATRRFGLSRRPRTADAPSRGRALRRRRAQLVQRRSGPLEP